MKRFIYAVLAMAALCALPATVSATAVKLKSREIGWMRSSTNEQGVATVFYKKRTEIDASSTPVDTTEAFSLEGVSCPPTALQVTANTDTVTVAWVRFFVDTTVAVTSDLSVVAYKTEVSGDGVNWKETANGTVSYNGIASGDTHFSIPLWFNSGEGYGAAGTKTSPLLTAPYIRVRFISATGTLKAVRCQLVYWE